MQLQGENYTLRFRRQLEPVSFFKRGKPKTEPRMATICELYLESGEKLATAKVRINHRDRYSRRAGNAAAFRKLANLFPSNKNSMLEWFFNSERREKIAGY